MLKKNLSCHSAMLPTVAYYAIYPCPLFPIMLSKNQIVWHYTIIFCCTESWVMLQYSLQKHVAVGLKTPITISFLTIFGSSHYVVWVWRSCTSYTTSSELVHYCAGIVPCTRSYLLCSKQCQHNVEEPICRVVDKEDHHLSVKSV